MRRSLSDANRPCGAPSYSMSVLPVMPLAAWRAEVSIGTVLSAVPWMMSVGTLNDARSGRKSVDENALAQPSVALRPACIDTWQDHSSTSSLTGCASMPAP